MRPSVLNRSYALELDLENQCLWRGDDPIYLTRKGFAVLKILIEQRDRVITKAEILRAAWPNARVEEGQVKQFIGQLRQLLHDDPEAPRFIETVHGRGYRFLGGIDIRVAPETGSLGPNATGPAILPNPDLVGREREVAALCDLFSEVTAGRRRTCLVSGEPGIGKTALVAHFVAHIALAQPVWHLRAKCMRHYHAVEPFLPIGNALEDLLRTSGHAALRDRVLRYAPGWSQWLTPWRPGGDPVAASTQARPGEHAIREFGQLVDVLAGERPVVLCVDDVHWADEATLSLLSYLAGSERPARLLILVTCPAQEALTESDACLDFAVQLRRHERCLKLVVPPLSEQAVAQYLARHCPQEQDLASDLHRDTEGHPLFVARIVEQLKREAGRASDYCSASRSTATEPLPIPDSVRELIEHEINRLDALDQELLETASVAGRVFSAAQLAPGVRMKVEEVERRCEALARHKRLLRRNGTAHWPDGTVAARYEFLHHFAARVLRDRVVPQRMRRLHRAMARRLETAYARHPDEVAAQLGEHFEAAGDFQRAARYVHVAGVNLLKQRPSAHAVAKFRNALALLEHVPASAERDRQELNVQINLALALQRSRSLDDSDVQAAYTRARVLYEAQPGTAHNSVAAWRMTYFYFLRGQLPLAQAIAEAALDKLNESRLAWAPPAIRAALASCTFHQADFAVSLQHAASGLQRNDSIGELDLPPFAPYEPRVHCHIHHAISQWALGYAAEADRHMDAARALAQRTSHPGTRVLALCYSAKLSQLQRHVDRAKTYAEAAIAAAQEHMLPVPFASATIVYGWALAQQAHAAEGLEQVQHGLRSLQATGARIGRGWHATLLAETQAAQGDLHRALHTVDEGLIALHQTGDRVAEAELYRLKGKLLFDRNATKDAEAALQRAVDVARCVGAKSWELRAALTHAQMLIAQRQPSRAHELLHTVYAAMPEHCDTHDHRHARQLLA